MVISKKTVIIFSSIFALLLVLVVGMFMRFIVLGKTESGTDSASLDTRVAVMMTAEERVFVLHEMRGMLEGVQEIIAAYRTKDMARISDVARGLGRNSVHGAPAGLMGKLPLAFKTLGLGTHASFDQISVTARDPEKADLVLLQLSNVMTNCVACHATYQIKTDKEAEFTNLGMIENKAAMSFFMDPHDSWQWQQDKRQALVKHLSSNLSAGS